MFDRIQILAILASLFLISITIELIRRRHLEEKYALSWLLTSIFFIICSINMDVIKFLSKLTGVIAPPNFLFLLAFFFLILVSLSLTVVVSREIQRNRKLTQELAVLKFNVETLNRRFEHLPMSKIKEGQNKPKTKGKDAV